MECGFLTFLLASWLSVHSAHAAFTDWDDVVVARAGSAATLVCSDETARGAFAMNWMAQPPGSREWSLVLSASDKRVFVGETVKTYMKLVDPHFRETGNFSLSFLPGPDDGGLYSCLIKQNERRLKEKIILLAVLTVSILPTPPIPQCSTLRLSAMVQPDFAVSKISWATPDGIAMRSERRAGGGGAGRAGGAEAKLPRVEESDGGAYACSVQPRGNSSLDVFTFMVNVSVHAVDVVSFTDVRHDPKISTATRAGTPLALTCPGVQGDYVRLQWQPPDVKRRYNPKVVYHYDRWRGGTATEEKGERLRLAGPPYSAEAGSFSFLLTPQYGDGGVYSCEVFLNDKPYSQSTVLSVMTVETKRTPSKLELRCRCSESSQIRSVSWRQQSSPLQPQMSSTQPGAATAAVPLPITSDTAGNYTCTLKLNNGQSIWAEQAVALPPEEHVGVTAPSMLPSLSALLLLVPLVAAAVGVLLWRRKHISDRGIEQSLSVHSGEAENIYENPEDIRPQAPPQGSVYMDLKPREENDVYKELERSEQCQS